MRSKAIGRLSAVFVILGMLFWLTAGLMLHSFAAGKGSISLVCRSMEGIILPGMHWKIYHAADRKGDGQYALHGDFSKYMIVVDASSDSALAITAQTFCVYAELDQSIVPVAEADSNAQGDLTFENLEDGMYLVCGDTYQLGNTYYMPSPFMIEVINAGGQGYNMMVNPKYSVRNDQEGGFDYTVKKFWVNDEKVQWNRSAYVTADIYRDGEVYQTVTLNDENNWEYSWHSDSLHEWNVVETYVPSKYYVIYRYNDRQYAIVNTYTDDDWATGNQTTDRYHGQITDTVAPPDTKPSTQDTGQNTGTVVETTYFNTGSGEEMTSSVSNSGSSSNPDSSDQTASRLSSTTRTTTVVPGTTTVQREKLPQTGQLWWPVPVLAAAGLILMTVGLRLRPKE